MKILFLPILQIPTGHHAVADSLISSIKKRRDNIECSKVDVFSYANPSLEKFLRSTYLRWIRRFPNSYGRIYLDTMHASRRDKTFGVLKIFAKHMKRLLEEEKPDLIVCTSSIPSHILEILLDTGYTTAPIVNVYTDFWMNNLWGITYADYHLVTDQTFKETVLKVGPKEPSRVYVTGIPVDERYMEPKPVEQNKLQPEILVSGGSMGLVGAKKVVQQIESMSGHGYSVTALCGRNKKLYENISHSNTDVKPIPYIHSSEAMNRLYDRCGAIITKPGGVTMSECLHKRLPAFIHGELPGQEEVNKNYLMERGLVHSLDWNQPLIQQLDRFFLDDEEVQAWRKRVDEYLAEIEMPYWEAMLKIIDEVEKG
ncbi:galactosyldiacylglycerol synthase [Alkalibacter rhizosphaerae]|uniref:Galactosyldiacylglycerol synthase n=1 Tax=Alkalibacter rhizosphaerae TaxID=2815577 RepID=A0A975AGR4_9FIRM|nr:galactosyldiacylglycerol synthase [Alkalibacter rhizosphaerae]QSX07834.1 galactosyldiacylglycerol synthase [Alkalibacter rhizosphaerae]